MRRRERRDGKEVLIATMTVGYKLIRESFTTEVILDADVHTIVVQYLDGPFSFLENRWRFLPLTPRSCEVDFCIAYSFRSRLLRTADGRTVRQGGAEIRRRVRGTCRRGLWRQPGLACLTAMSARSASAWRTHSRRISPRPIAPSRSRSCLTGASRRAAAKMHEPDRLLHRSAPGTGNAGDGDGARGARISERAADHGAGHVLAHRAVPLDQPDRNAEHLALRRVRIGDEAALDHVGGAGDGGQRGGEQPAGAGFCGGEQIPLLAAGVKECSSLGNEARVDQKLLRSCAAHHGRLTVAVAIAAIPSPRPMKPRPSLVVALMLTWPTSRPRHSAIFTRIAIAIGPDARRLADKRQVHVHDLAVPFADPRRGVLEEQLGGHTAPARVGRREVHTDIAVGDRAEQSVGQRMQADIGIAVADELLLMRNEHAAQNHRIARPEGMHVVAGGDADRARRAPAERGFSSSSALAMSSAEVSLRLSFRAFDQGDIETVPFGNAGIVGERRTRLLRRGAMGGEDRIEVETLRGLCAPQLIALGSVPVTRPAFARVNVSVTGRQGRAPA